MLNTTLLPTASVPSTRGTWSPEALLQAIHENIDVLRAAVEPVTTVYHYIRSIDVEPPEPGYWERLARRAAEAAVLALARRNPAVLAAAIIEIYEDVYERVVNKAPPLKRHRVFERVAFNVELHFAEALDVFDSELAPLAAVYVAARVYNIVDWSVVEELLASYGAYSLLPGNPREAIGVLAALLEGGG